MEFVFTLKYQMPVKDCEQAPLVQRLGAVGFRDVQVTAGLRGRLMLSFVRQAERADLALMTALREVRRAIPGARLVEAAPDMVGLTEVAKLAGVSRQNMRKLMMTHPTTFPPPMHEGQSTSVWHLSDVLVWLRGRGTYPLSAAVIEVAAAAKTVNAVRQCRHVDARRREELAKVLA